MLHFLVEHYVKLDFLYWVHLLFSINKTIFLWRKKMLQEDINIYLINYMSSTNLSTFKFRYAITPNINIGNVNLYFSNTNQL